MAAAAQSLDPQIISLEVSPFDYDDYSNLFESYSNDGHNIELRTIIDNLGFNINLPIAIITKANGDVIAQNIASSHTEVDEYMKDAINIMTLGLWTCSKQSKEVFNNEIMPKLFKHACKIDYQIKQASLDEIITIRRIYTMSSRLNTVQVVEFIQEFDAESNTKKWVYFDIHKVQQFQKIKPLIEKEIDILLAEENPQQRMKITNSKVKPFYLEKKNIILYNRILDKYIHAIHKIYDFYIDEDFEEIDDNDMWEHELFQPGLHIIENN